MMTWARFYLPQLDRPETVKMSKETMSLGTPLECRRESFITGDQETNSSPTH